jgi:hypothetical protein
MKSTHQKPLGVCILDEKGALRTKTRIVQTYGAVVEYFSRKVRAYNECLDIDGMFSKVYFDEVSDFGKASVSCKPSVDF